MKQMHKKVTAMFVALVMVCALLPSGFLAMKVSAASIESQVVGGNTQYQVTEPATTGTIRTEVLAVFAAMVPGDTLAFLNDVVKAVKLSDGSLEIEVWPTADLEEIRTAQYALMPGDTLLFHEGTYVRVPALWAGQGNNPTNSGTVEKPITIKGYGNGEARPFFNNIGSGQNIWEVKMNYVDISYMKFSGDNSGLRLDGVDMLAKGITISDCVFDNISNTNIATNASGMTIEDILIENNTFINANYAVIYFGTHGNYPGAAAGGGAGEPTGTTGSNIVIRGNFIDGSNMSAAGSYVGYGIEFKVDVSNSVIERNLIINTKGPGLMFYGADDQTTVPNIARDNLIVGSWQSAGINIGGGPSIAENNIALGNQSYGVYIQNYGARNINTNITIENNTSGLTVGSNVDYTIDGNTDSTTNAERNVLVQNNNFFSKTEADSLLTRQVETIKQLTAMPANATAFFDAIGADPGPYTQAELVAKLGVVLQGITLVEPNYGKDPITTTGNNFSGFYVLPEPIQPNGAGIATLSFKYTAEAGTGSLVQGLKLYVSIFGSNSGLTTSPNPEGSLDMFPIRLEFARDTATGLPSALRMRHSTGGQTGLAACIYGKTYDIKVEINIPDQTYRLVVDGVASGVFRPLMDEGKTYAPLTDIGAVSINQWNNTGSTYAVLGDIPWKVQAPKDYGVDAETIGSSSTEIVEFPAPIVPVDGLLRYKFRLSPQTLRDSDDTYKFVAYLYEDGVVPTAGSLQTKMPMSMNFALDTRSGMVPVVRFYTGAGNEGAVGNRGWDLKEVYDVEFIADVAAQLYKIVVYDAVGNVVTESTFREFFEPGSGGPEYTVPVTSIGAVAFEQIGGTSIIGNILESVPEAVDIGSQTEFILSTAAEQVRKGDYFEVNAGFAEETQANVINVNFSYNPDLFRFAGYTLADGVTVLDIKAVDNGNGGFAMSLMVPEYGVTNLISFGLIAKEDGNLQNGEQSISATVECVIKVSDELDDSGFAPKEIVYFDAALNVPTFGGIIGDTNNDGVLDLIDLSNIIDAFGIDTTDAKWDTVYKYLDFNENGSIDIADISHVAWLVVVL